MTSPIYLLINKEKYINLGKSMKVVLWMLVLIGPHSKPLESETLQVSPENLQATQVTLRHTKV